jgi:hypothetical protein
MEVVTTKEHKDGSVSLTFSMSKKEEDKLLKYAILDILSKGMKNKNRN